MKLVPTWPGSTRFIVGAPTEAASNAVFTVAAGSTNDRNAVPALLMAAAGLPWQIMVCPHPGAGLDVVPGSVLLIMG